MKTYTKIAKPRSQFAPYDRLLLGLGWLLERQSHLADDIRNARSTLAKANRLASLDQVKVCRDNLNRAITEQKIVTDFIKLSYPNPEDSLKRLVQGWK